MLPRKMYNPKFARKNATFDLITKQASLDEESKRSHEHSDKESEVEDKQRIAESFKLVTESYRAPPKLIPEPPAELNPDQFTLSEYLRRPDSRDTNHGTTSRVTRILENSKSVVRGQPKIIKTDEREQFELKIQKLEDEISRLNSVLRNSRSIHEGAGRAKDSSSKTLFMEIGRKADSEGLQEEVTLLRKENYSLRNMTDGEREVHAGELIVKLRWEIESLKRENARLTRLLVEYRDNHLLGLKPPRDDIPDLNNIKRIPLEISNIEKERVMKVLEDERAYASSISRHGKAHPIKDPFQRRRFDHN